VASLAAALMLVLASSASARAAHWRFRPLGPPTDSPGLTLDGGHYGVFQISRALVPPTAPLLVYNAKTGSLSQLSVPGCFVDGAIPGIVLAQCGQMRAAAPTLPVGMVTDYGHLELVRVPSGHRSVVPNGALGPSDGVGGFGRLWIARDQYDQMGGFTGAVDFLNWHTGKHRLFTDTVGISRDVNSPTLRRLPDRPPIVAQAGLGGSGAQLILRQPTS